MNHIIVHINNNVCVWGKPKMETPNKSQTNIKTNIIHFPTNKRIPNGIIVPPEFKVRQIRDYLTSINNDISEAIIGTLESTGVKCDSEEFHNNMVIITLLLENMLFRTENIEHAFDEMLDALQEAIVEQPTTEESIEE